MKLLANRCSARPAYMGTGESEKQSIEAELIAVWPCAARVAVAGAETGAVPCMSNEHEGLCKVSQSVSLQSMQTG